MIQLMKQLPLFNDVLHNVDHGHALEQAYMDLILKNLRDLMNILIIIVTVVHHVI